VSDKITKSGVNPSARRKARHYAMQALYQWYMTGHNLSEIESQFRADYEFSKVDLAFFQDIVHQAPANMTELEAAFTPHLDRKIDALDPIELSLLRLGSYELLKRIDVPYKVVINEAVSLAKKFGATDGHKFINGVLDKVAQDVRGVEIEAEKKPKK
jgi:N utilization substance protein B